MAGTFQNNERYAALDGLRGIAALAVVALHTTGYFQLGFKVNHGYLAVDFFFMLSGFVLAYAYDPQFENGLSVLDFAVIRIIRLYPLVFLGIAVGTSALLGSIYFGWDVPLKSVLMAAAANALLLPSPAMLTVRPWAFPINNPLWSLAFEFWINIIFAATFTFFTEFRLWLIILFGAGLVCWTGLNFGSLDVGFRWQDYGLGCTRVIFPFAMGIMLSRILRDQPVVKFPWGHAACLPLLAVITAPSFGSGIYDSLTVLVAFPIIILVAAKASALPKVDRVWRYLGEISYPLYVTHYPIIVVVSTVERQLGLNGVALNAAACLCFIFDLTFAALALRFYDKPVRASLKQWVKKRKIVWIEKT